MKDNQVATKKNQYHHLVRVAMSIFLFACEIVVLYIIWTNKINPIMAIPFYSNGMKYVVIAYAVMLLVFSKIYGGTRIGYFKVFDIIISQSLCSLLSNIGIYFFVLTSVVRGFVTPIPLALTTLCDIAVIVVWSLVSNKLFMRIFPPQKLIIVSEQKNDNIIEKFNKRPDRFIIEKELVVGSHYTSEEIANVASGIIRECEEYDGVIIGDIADELRNSLVKKAFQSNVRTYTIPTLSDIVLRSGDHLHVFDAPVFLNRNFGLSPEQTAVKRCFDVIFSLFCIIITSPVMLITAGIIKLQDGGKVFYTQERCSKDNEIFRIIKFRSMVEDAEKLENGGVQLAGETDSRITKFGSVIRSLRIDELPQLFNILKGDMSFVGPRPERPEIIKEYTKNIPEFSYRTKVKAGLTGYAQVYGKYNTLPADKLKFDVMYIADFSFGLDLLILFKTVKTVLKKENAQGFDDESKIMYFSDEQEITK